MRMRIVLSEQGETIHNSKPSFTQGYWQNKCMILFIRITENVGLQGFLPFLCCIRTRSLRIQNCSRQLLQWGGSAYNTSRSLSCCKQCIATSQSLPLQEHVREALMGAGSQGWQPHCCLHVQVLLRPAESQDKGQMQQQKSRTYVVVQPQNC